MSSTPEFRVTIGDVSFVVDPTGTEKYWRKVNDGRWEPETFRLFRDFITADTAFVDIGGWIGPTTLYGGQLAMQTITLEPNPAVFPVLSANVAKNAERLGHRVKLINAALWTENTILTLQSDDEAGSSTGSIIRAMADGGAPAENRTFQAQAIEMEAIYKKLSTEARLFVKMDVEGAEYFLLEHIIAGLAERKATLLISTHPEILHTDIGNQLARRRAQANAQQKFVATIQAAGYRVLTKTKRDYSPQWNGLKWSMMGKMQKDLLCLPV